MLRLILHIVGLAQFSYALYYDLQYVDLPESMGSYEFQNIGGFRGRAKYLSLLNLPLQALFYGICIINDVFGSHEINPKTKPIIRKIKDYLQASLAFPLAMFVGILFWTMMAVDRDLAFPKIMDQHVPTWLNHVVHTNIMIFAILEVATSFCIYPKRSNGLKGLLAFMVTYFFWTRYIYFKTGEWVYPVFNKLNWVQRILFFVGMLAIAVLLYFAGEFLNNKVWAKAVKQHESQKKRGNKKVK